MTIITEYKCDICGKIYYSRAEAEQCESRGIIQPLLKVGDVIHFCDCKDTPVIWFEDVQDSRLSPTFKRYSTYKRYPNPYNLYQANTPLYQEQADTMLLYCKDRYCNKKIEIKLNKIIYETPHIPTYRFCFLDGVSFAQGDDKWNIVFEYPTLSHDELLLQLEKYNPDIKIR